MPPELRVDIGRMVGDAIGSVRQEPVDDDDQGAGGRPRGDAVRVPGVAPPLLGRRRRERRHRADEVGLVPQEDVDVRPRPILAVRERVGLRDVVVLVAQFPLRCVPPTPPLDDGNAPAEDGLVKSNAPGLVAARRERELGSREDPQVVRVVRRHEARVRVVTKAVLRRHHAFAQRLVARAVPRAQRRVGVVPHRPRLGVVRPGREVALGEAGHELPRGLDGPRVDPPDEVKIEVPRRPVDEVPRELHVAPREVQRPHFELLVRSQAVGVRRQAAAAERFARGRVGVALALRPAVVYLAARTRGAAVGVDPRRGNSGRLLRCAPQLLRRWLPRPLVLCIDGPLPQPREVFSEIVGHRAA